MQNTLEKNSIQSKAINQTLKNIIILKQLRKSGKNSYEIIFDTEQHKGDNTQKPQTVHLYNIHEIKEVPVRSGSGKTTPLNIRLGTPILY